MRTFKFFQQPKLSNLTYEECLVIDLIKRAKSFDEPINGQYGFFRDAFDNRFRVDIIAVYNTWDYVRIDYRVTNYATTVESIRKFYLDYSFINNLMNHEAV